MIILAVILILFLFGNWLINETLIFFPVQLVVQVTSIGWWVLAILGILFLAWCIGEE